MDTDTQESVIVRRRRWPWIGALVVVAVVVGLVSSGIIYIAQYEPIRQTFSIGPMGVTGQHVETYGDPSVFVFDYKDEQEFGIYFQLLNEGPLGVTITDVDLFPPDNADLVFPVELLDLRIDDGRHPSESERFTVPFEPFTLEPEAYRTILVRARFDDCEHHFGAGGGLRFIFEDTTVRYRVFGIRRQMEVPLMTRFVLPMRAKDCPQRSNA